MAHERIGFLGLGNMGTALAHLMTSSGRLVTGWDYDPQVVSEINQRHTNSRYLSGISLSANLTAVSDLDEMIDSSELLFIAIPSLYIAATLGPYQRRIGDQHLLINLAKGFDPKTGKTAVEILEALFPETPLLMLGGPAVANEFARGLATAVILAGSDPERLRRLRNLLTFPQFKVGLSDDRRGTELGGILKNIYAIGLGLLKGQQGINFRSLYLTAAFREMARLGTALGGEEKTFYDLPGVSDLLATSLSEHSHNRRFGELLAEGESVDSAEKRIGLLPEGIRTLRILKARGRLAEKATAIAFQISKIVEKEAIPETLIDIVLDHVTGKEMP